MQNLLTVRDWVRWGSSQFVAHDLYFGHGTDNAWDEACVLALWAIHQPWERLNLIFDAHLTTEEASKIRALYEQRVQRRVPASYLTGEAWFGGLKFKVTEDVLVPRSPIAELVLSGFHPWLNEAPRRVLDMCTGSGCIGILCAKSFDSKVDLVDISTSALAVAEENIRAHGVAESVEAIQSDVFSSLSERKYDVIVSNPPYVDAKDLGSMPSEYRAEPVLGLAAGDDGLDIVRKIIADAGRYLEPDGLLVVEVGNSWVALEEAFPNVPFYWPEFESGGHGVFILTAEQLMNITF